MDRASRYAEAIWDDGFSDYARLRYEQDRIVSAVMAVADAEIAELLSEVRSLRRSIEKEHCAACGNGQGLCRDCEAEALTFPYAECTCGNFAGHDGECR